MKILPTAAMLPLALPVVIAIFLTACGTVDYEKKYPNMVANAEPVSAGTISVQFDKFLSSKLNKAEVGVIFHPRLNAVSLEFRYEYVNYRQFWDEAARRQFAEALESYKVDYDARKLLTTYNKTRRAYGKLKGWTEWESHKYTKTHTSYPVIELGYRFRDNSPYFSTFMRSAREEDSTGVHSGLVESQQIPMYFVRSQADELVKLFDQTYLMGLVNVRAVAPIIDGSIEVDPYREQ
jgi:hypothetical protein